MNEVAKSLISMVVQNLHDAVQRAKTAKETSDQDAREADGAMMSRYNTFLEEAQYLASGHKARMLEMQATADFLTSLLQENPESSERIVATSIVTIEDQENGEKRTYLLLPGGGGEKYTYEGREIIAVNVPSPLGRALVQHQIDDDVRIPGSPHTWTVLSIE